MLKSVNNIQPFYNNNVHFKSNPIHTDNSPREFKDDFYIDAKGAEALKVRNFVSSPTDVNKPISKSDYVNKLKQAGFVEDKDFDCIGNSVFINNKNGSAAKVVQWYDGDGDGEENYSGYVDVLNVNNDDIETIMLHYDKNNYLTEKTTTYRNPEKFQDLLPDELKENDTTDKYISYLEKNNIPYDIDEKNIITEEGDFGYKYTLINDDSIYQSVGKDSNEKSIHLDKENNYLSVNETVPLQHRNSVFKA